MTLWDELENFSEPPLGESGSRWKMRFLFPPDFIGFQGHFPNNPVLPAIAQICMARLLWSRVIAPVAALDIKTAKFREPLRPNQEIMLSLERGGLVELHSAGELCSLFKVKPCSLKFA